MTDFERLDEDDIADTIQIAKDYVYGTRLVNVKAHADAFAKALVTISDRPAVLNVVATYVFNQTTTTEANKPERVERFVTILELLGFEIVTRGDVRIEGNNVIISKWAIGLRDQP